MNRNLLSVIFGLAAVSDLTAQVIRTNPGFYKNSVPRNDDGSGPATPLGFSINFFGKVRDTAFVNNNGNITFDSPLSTFTPFGLQKTSREIIAPFFADVDTRGPGSTLVTYGQDTVGGRKAFAANYIEVGYYERHDDKRNRVQVVVIDRSDTGPGNFNIEFNYERIVWETGDASGGTGGFGGVPATVGWSNGTTDDGSSFQLEGSMVRGAFLDTGPRALIRAHMNTATVGRLLFQARDGSISEGLKIAAGTGALAAITGSAYEYSYQATGIAGPVTWELLPDIALPDGLTFSNGRFSGTPTTPGTFTFTISATADIDGEKVTVSQRGSITVSAPRLAISTACPLADGTAGQPYSAQFSAQGSTSQKVWSVLDRTTLPPGITLSSAGLLGGVPSAPGNYPFTIHAQGPVGSDIEPAAKACRIAIRPAEVKMTSGCSLPAATVGVPYAQALTVDGGIGPYTFQLIGQLPLGLSLTGDGIVTGIPLVAAVNPFQVQVTDARRTVRTNSCTVAVNDPSIAIGTACPLPTATTGAAYSAALSAQGGSGSYTWSVSGTLPQGLSLSPDGRISGTPMSAGPFQFRLIAADSNGQQAARACSLAVQNGPMSIGSCPLPEATVGALYTATLNPLGGSEPYVWSQSGNLPAGIRLSSTGIVDGTPSAPGDFQFALSLRDRSMQTITQPCSIRVKPLLLSLASACPAPSATVGQPYSVRFSAKGGVAPYRFDFIGYLPDGLSASSDGVVSGTPSSVGPASFAVRITDAQGTAVRPVCSMDVVLPRPPAVRFSTMPATVAAANSNLRIGIELDNAYPLPITGQLTLAVQPDTRNLSGAANTADPRARFSNGQYTTGFTVPAGVQRIEVPLLSTGTVASTMVVTVTSLRAGGTDLPAAISPLKFQVPAAAPSITSSCFTKTTTAITMTVVGSSTTRELTSAEVTAGTLDIVTSLSGASTEYFGDARTVRTGGAFTLQFGLDSAFQNSNGPFTLALSNSAGKSSAVTAQRCQ